MAYDCSVINAFYNFKKYCSQSLKNYFSYEFKSLSIKNQN